MRFSFSFAHHGKYSSYHRLLAYLEENESYVDATAPWLRRLPGKWSSRLEWRWLRYMEAKAWAQCQERGEGVFHYLYPENSCFRGDEFKKNEKVLVSCHQPASFIDRYRGTQVLNCTERALELADAVAVLGKEEVPLYESMAPHAKVRFIPHGVDSEWFYPVLERPDKDVPVVLTVGNWLRDYSTWAAVVNMVEKAKLKVCFKVLASPSTLAGALSELSDQARSMVMPLSAIDDCELRSVYWESDLLFLPLKASMANNALLEAMATGTPILTTKLPGTIDYSGSCSAYFEEGNAEDAFSALVSLLKRPDTRSEMAKSALQKVSSSLTWPRVLEQLNALTEEV